MKRISLILTAMALVLGLSQCKKQEQETQASTGGTVAITLEVKAPAGQRIDVNTANGEVTFEENDTVHVAYRGQHVGTLTYKGKTFKGNLSIDPAATGDNLHFYFLGNKAPTFNGTTCTVDISDQTRKLPVISCAESNEVFNGPGLYTAYFLNKAALVEFEVSPRDLPLYMAYDFCLTGLNNTVTVDFSNGTFTYDKVNDGLITFRAWRPKNYIRKTYGILLPQGELGEGDEGSAYAVVNGLKTWQGKRPAISEIYENDFNSLNVELARLETAAIPGRFTINRNGDKVYFSRGNLQYNTSSSSWQFADKQWEALGSQQYGTRDLFGWGTGDDPTKNSTSYALYSTFNEWGNNPISNGGNQANQWRTLTADEWDFILNSRTSTRRFAFGRIRGGTYGMINGLILLPDNWETYSNTYNYLNSINASALYTANTISMDDWKKYEDLGAVFLPTTGSRNGTSVDATTTSTHGLYWTSSIKDDTAARNLYIDDQGHSSIGANVRYFGLGVRLVQDVN